MKYLLSPSMQQQQQQQNLQQWCKLPEQVVGEADDLQMCFSAVKKSYFSPLRLVKGPLTLAPRAN
jgi:hypothetical protein